MLLRLTRLSDLSSYVELETEDSKKTPLLFEHPNIVELSKKYEKSPAQIVLRWATQRGLAVIPKSANPERHVQNLSVTNFDLSGDDIKSISAMNRNLRFNDPMKVMI